jgi:hypothetical protein
MLLKVVRSLEGMVADLGGEERPLSMGSLMPLSGVSSAELFVTDTAAVKNLHGSSYAVTGFSSLYILCRISRR